MLSRNYFRLFTVVRQVSSKRLMDFEGTATFEKTFRNPERKISARSSNIIEEFL
jgi:hypothetical protein